MTILKGNIKIIKLLKKWKIGDSDNRLSEGWINANSLV